MAKLIKIGIIGCGGIANGKHMPSLQKVADCEMVAFCDIIPERAEEAAKKFGTSDAKVYTDYKELFRIPRSRSFTFARPTVPIALSRWTRWRQAST